MMRQRYHHYKFQDTRTTARGIVIHDNQILLIERWRYDQHYYSIPGGGVDEGETMEEALIREMREETTLEIKPERLLYDLTDKIDDHRHFIYLCRYFGGTPVLPPDSDEAKAGPDNRFAPCWLPLTELEKVPFGYWEPLRRILVQDLKQGFARNVKITSF